MSERTRERVTELHGYRWIRLKSGRLVGFWDTHSAAQGALTELSRAVSRAFKLANDDYDLERLDAFLDELDGYVGAVRHAIEERRGVRTREERIALLRNVTGRTEAEAEAFRLKADELEAGMRDHA